MLRVVFLGTPDFAVASLNAIVNSPHKIVGVVTAPDKPAGRGQQLSKSAVKEYAEKNSLNILQPTNLKDPAFLSELMALKADIFVVVAFRMLPEVVWQMPPRGTFNLHASWLPQYRGAAPINWAIINGEKTTGVTTFFLKKEIDTGEIIFHEKVEIGDNETAGELHDKLMVIGAKLVVNTLNAIEDNTFQRIDQKSLFDNENELKVAPKIFKETCKINWNESAQKIHNHIRGLSPYPAAFTNLISPEGQSVQLKIFKTTFETTDKNYNNLSINTDQKKLLNVVVNKDIIHIHELQLAGKKRMTTEEFLRGFKLNNDWKVQ